MKKNWIPKKQTVVITSIFLVLCIITYLGALIIANQKQKEIENIYRNSESEVSKQERKWILKSALSLYAEEISTLRNLFIKKGDEVNFIEKIESLGQQSGIKFEIKSIDLKNKTEDSFKEDINIKISISGKWENILSFLDSLEKMPFGALVDSVDLDTNAPGEWEGNISLIVFREK